MLPSSAMSILRASAGAPLLWLLLSCVGAPPAPQAPAAALKAAPAVSSSPAPELGAVPDPPALVVSGRLAKPSASLAIVRAWTKLPMPQAEEVTELAMGTAAGALVDLDQPIDFAVAVTGMGLHLRDRSAVSLALKNVDAAKATLAEHFKLVPGDNGALLLQAVGHSDRHDDDETEGEHDGDEPRPCEIAPSYGSAPMRLVCGWSPQALSEVGPWLTRTMTRTAATSDLHVDLRLQPLRPAISAGRRFIGGLLASGVAGGAAGVRDFIAAIAGDAVDFALDLESASLDVVLTEPEVSANATLRFSGRASSLTRIATAHPDRAAAPPPAYWQLPADADFAVFGRGIDEAEFAHWRDPLLRMVGDLLAEYDSKDADKKAVLDALGKLISSAPLVYASGLDSDGARKAIAAEASLGDGADANAVAEARRVSAEALFGWRIVGIDEPSARLSGAMKDLASAWARPGILRALRAKSKGTIPLSLRAAPLSKGVALPAGAEHYVLEIAPFGAPSSSAPAPGAKGHAPVASKPVSIHLFLLPDGARTWVALGGGEALVASKLAATIGPAGGKLENRAELGSLKSSTIGAGGFMTARGLAAASEQMAGISGDSTRGAAAVLEEVDRLPHRGAVPLVFSLTPRPDPSPSPVVVSLDLSRAAIEDIVTAIMRHGF